MRFLSRAPRPAAVPQRPRPARRLRRRAMVGAGALIAVLALAGGATRLAHATWVAEAATAAQARVAKAGTALGFAVANVSVVGRERESRSAILGALGVARGMPILGLDLGLAKTRLEALPWVRVADVERLLPDTIMVRLSERRPLAFWQRHGTLVLVADDGTIIPTSNLDDFGALIVLVGDDAPRFGASLIDMLASEPDLARHVAAAVRIGGRRWNLRLDNGIDVALPERDPEAAWHRLAALDRSEQLLERNILAVDLRLADRLVLRLPPEPAKSLSPKSGKPAGKPT
jgi:cell division protein FtsQ